MPIKVNKLLNGTPSEQITTRAETITIMVTVRFGYMRLLEGIIFPPASPVDYPLIDLYYNIIVNVAGIEFPFYSVEPTGFGAIRPLAPTQPYIVTINNPKREVISIPANITLNWAENAASYGRTPDAATVSRLFSVQVIEYI